MNVLYKLGGSLLIHPSLPELLELFFQQEEERYQLSNPNGENPWKPIIVVGGGEVADCIRDWDGRFIIGQKYAHWLAIKSLSLTAGLVAKLSSRTAIAEEPESIKRIHTEAQIPILDVERFVTYFESKGLLSLEHNWNTTSDTIALSLALLLEVDEFILLKSCDLNTEHHLPDKETINTTDEDNGNLQTIMDISRRGLIDAAFPQWWKNRHDIHQNSKGGVERKVNDDNGMRLGWVNLRGLDHTVRWVNNPQ